MRLDKFLVEMGIGSRSQVKQYVKKGTVTVNGAPVKSSDVKIDENNDTIKYNGRILNYSRYRYFLLNKPAGCVSATKDNVHQTVIDLLKGENTKDLSPVGRLDIDTEGLLLLTNDGALTHHLLSPAHHIPKTYYAEIDGYVTDDTINLFATGVDIGDEKPTLPADLRILSSDSTAARSEIELIIPGSSGTLVLSTQQSCPSLHSISSPVYLSAVKTHISSDSYSLLTNVTSPRNL